MGHQMYTAVEMESIYKKFGKVIANDGISITLQKNEVHALVGENGAGKTTLMNILYGLLLADSGTIRLGGREVPIDNPREAINLGIGMVHQHFMLVPELSVADNIVLGQEQQRNGLLKHQEAWNIVKELGDRFGLPVEPKVRIRDLPVGIQQRVEILKLLYRGAEVLILDEPTAVLTPQEVNDLIRVLRNLSKEGKAVVLITHKLDEVMEVADRVSVLRDGKKVGSVLKNETNTSELANMMVGRPVILESVSAAQEVGNTVLRVEKIKAKNKRGLDALKDLSFSVKEGEILGIAGVTGNGQTELVECIAGLRDYSGRIWIDEREVTGQKPKTIRASGLAHIPGDRNRMGISVAATVEENLVISRHDAPPIKSPLGIKKNAIRKTAKELIRHFQIKISSPAVAVRTLSGGNQQKVVVARELSEQPRIAMVSQPTRGLDIGAIEFIHDELLRIRDEGACILLVSTELDEILRLSDRILVIYAGKIQGELKSHEANPEKLGLLMAGSSK